MSNPRLGMAYDDVVRRIKRIQGNPGNPEAKGNIIRSLKNQCRLAEGEKALIEMDTDLSKDSSFFSGAGSKQIGFGEGRRLGDGRWRYADGKWQKLE